LLAEAWLHALKAFEEPFLAALKSDAPADDAALATPRFCRQRFDLACVLACCRKEEFVGAETPAAISTEITATNRRIDNGIRRFARAIDRPLLACRLALAIYPLAAVKVFLPDNAPPVTLDGEILKATRAALA
jgi:hypothetical protein